jgi:hypothetical protein
VHWRALVAFAVYSYLRDGELRALLCGDVDVEHAIIRVNKAWIRKRGKDGTPGRVGSPKGDEPREVAIEPTLVALINSLKAGRSDNAPLFEKWPSERDMARGLGRWLLKLASRVPSFTRRDRPRSQSPSTTCGRPASRGVPCATTASLNSSITLATGSFLRPRNTSTMQLWCGVGSATCSPSYQPNSSRRWRTG